jgi:hypothetical protein
MDQYERFKKKEEYAAKPIWTPGLGTGFSSPPEQGLNSSHDA